MHIFLADDDSDDVELFGEMLETVDPAIVFNSASNGVEAMEYLESHEPPAAIFLDLNMPMVDGKKCLQAIKQSTRLKAVPVIMFTTSSFPNDVGDCVALGAVCFITKPTDVADWQTILRAVVNNLKGDIKQVLSGLHGLTEVYC